MNRDELDYLIDYMLSENENFETSNPHRFNRKKDIFRILCNSRPAKSIDENFLKRYDKFLDELNNEKDLIDVDNIKTIKELYASNKYKNSDKIAILKADITAIKIDAIVNSASPSMQGCFIPLHKNCIDNAIHFFAGIELKNECVEILENKKKKFIATGKGIVTNAYHLPCKKIIHMVVPKSNGFPSDGEYEALIKIYIKTLKKLIKRELKTIAICSMGTGLYKFPKKETLTRVLKSIDEFLEENKNQIEKVVLVEYTLEDFKILENIVLENSSEAINKEEKPKIPRTAKIVSKAEKEIIKKKIEEIEKENKNESGRLIISEMVNRLSGENNDFVNQDYIRKVDRPKYEKIIYTLLPEEEIIYDDDSFKYEKKKRRRSKKQEKS